MGRITLRVNTRGYTGKIRKSAKVNTNESRDRFHYISIEAFVKNAVTVSPETVHLQGQAGEEVRATVEIKAQGKGPLRLQPLSFDLPDKVNYTIEEVQKGRIYRVHFSSIPGAAEKYYGFLNFRTNYSERPEISIGIRGKFKN